MQLVRAEGERLRQDQTSDLRSVMRVIVDDIGGRTNADRIRLRLPDRPVISDIDPDMVGILCRTLIDNAPRHGSKVVPVEVTLCADGQLTVVNEGPVVPNEQLARLTNRFERANGKMDGSGLGLAIVAAIADRIGSPLVLQSPRPGQEAGFEATVRIPTIGSEVPTGAAADRGVSR
jgi:two-component system, OmpR family, sensor kinase